VTDPTTTDPHGLASVDQVLDGGWVATCTCGHTTTAYATRARARFWQAEHHGRHVEPRWTRDDHEDFWRTMRAEERKELGE